MTVQDTKVTSDLLLPEAKAFYKTLEGGKPWMHMSPEEVRKEWAAEDPEPFVQPDSIAEVYNVQAASRTGTPIPLRVYEPKGEGPFPIILYYHGGGFIGGDNDDHASIAANFCQYCQAVVVAVEYRLAPEHPFPAAVEDAYDALVWASKPPRAEILNADPMRIACCGESAGGALSAVMSLISRDEGYPKIRPGLCAQVMISAVTNMAELDTPSQAEFEHDRFEGMAELQWFYDHYLPPGTDRRHPWASPKYAKDLSGLPPCFCLTAEVDSLRDEAEDYAKALEAAGVEVKLKRYKGHFHNSMIDTKMFPEAGVECFKEISDFLHKAWKLD